LTSEEIEQNYNSIEERFNFTGLPVSASNYGDGSNNNTASAYEDSIYVNNRVYTGRFNTPFFSSNRARAGN
jgi:hypothetical protein